MALKKAFKRLTTPARDLDRAQLRDYCAKLPGVTPIVEVGPRQEASVAGEVTMLRIVPRPDGSSWLEATVSDGTGSVVAMWTGRRAIAGLTLGRRLRITGRGSPKGPGGRLLVYNPLYELLA